MGSAEELWAMQQHVPPGGKVVLWGLAGFSGGGDTFGECTRVDMDYLTDLTGYPPERIEAIISRLMEWGYLTVEPTPYPFGDEYTGTQYRLVEYPERES